MSEFARYARQTQLAEIGLIGQKRLASNKVLIVGAGGLGCTVAVYLAGAGVGNITLVDHDDIDLSNLHRQILYREDDVGLPKAQVAQRELQRLNSDINVTAHIARLVPSNAQTLSKDVDLIIDAADNLAVSYLLSDASSTLNRPLLSASVNRTFGYVGLFGVGAPSLRAVFPRVPEEQTSCETVGVTGPGVGVIASLQAQEALKALLGSSTLAAKMLYLDLWNYRQHIINFSNAVDPGQGALQFIEQADLTNQDYVIDVRSPDEVSTSPQPFNVDRCVPLSELLQDAHSFPGTRLVFVCRSGQRAMLAAQVALDQGETLVAALLPNA